MSSPTDALPAAPPLLDLVAPAPTQPILLTGRASAVVLSGSGEVALPLETRGGVVEWGGAYGQGIRLTGPWRVSGLLDGVTHPLAATLERLRATRWGVDSWHRWGRVEVHHEVVALPTAPGAARRLTLRSDQPVALRVDAKWSPFLAPVLVEGIKPYEYQVRTRGGTIVTAAHACALALASDPLPFELALDGRPWIGGSFRGEVGTIRTSHAIELEANTPRQLTWVVWGGLASALDAAPTVGAETLAVASPLSALSARPWQAWIARTPELSFPDDPLLERAYDLARGALRALYTEPQPGMTGLVAGYPWYAALWCRDLAWMLPAVIWLGDAEWAQASIETVLRYQARARIPLLGAEVGELPMQVSPGPVFLFGTSDTSLYYPDLVRRLVDHSGRLDAARAWWPHLRAIAGWARAKTDPASGLIANGGEVAEIRDAAMSVGSVHFGIDAVDTTIWDSTDRRDHAIDVQVLYHGALTALVDLGQRLGLPTDAADWTGHAAGIARGLADRYVWPEESYLYDSLRRDGTPVEHVRPNALRVVSAGLLAADRAKSIVERAGRPDLATSWGVRTLSDRDPTFDPRAYHDGQVWTIATAWASDAAFAVGEVDRAMGYLHQNAERIVREHGLAQECYRGDADAPFDSCFLLGFSVAPFLSLLFERLWGLRVEAGRGVLSVLPEFPAGWRSASVRHLRVGEGYVDLAWSNGALEAAWAGPAPLEIRVTGASDRLEPGGRCSLPLPGREPS